MLRTLKSDRIGGTIVEMALVGPVFLLLLFAIFETSAFLLASTLLEGGVREASRFAITGRTDLGSRDATIRSVIENHSVGILTAEKIDIDYSVFPSFDSIGFTEEFDDANGNGVRDAGEGYTDSNGNGTFDDGNGTPGAGGAEDIVLYRVGYDWQLIVPILRPFLPPDGTIRLEAQIAVRNEPFPES
jgi:Flp pilus assembly protein TadG